MSFLFEKYEGSQRKLLAQVCLRFTTGPLHCLHCMYTRDTGASSIRMNEIVPNTCCIFPTCHTLSSASNGLDGRRLFQGRHE